MREKREFVKHVLNYMEDRDFIRDWDSAGEQNRHDYVVTLNSGRTAAIELKGCLDGNNTNIFERPPNASEFVVWSVCTNASADPRHNAWSGLHTRLGAEIIYREQLVDGVIIWDWLCGTSGRPCPKVNSDTNNLTEVGPYELPPPCIYVMPGTLPSPRNNPHPQAQSLEEVSILKAFNDCFKGRIEDINFVDFEVSYQGADLMRKTRIHRDGVTCRESDETAIQRS